MTLSMWRQYAPDRARARSLRHPPGLRWSPTMCVARQAIGNDRVPKVGHRAALQAALPPTEWSTYGLLLQHLPSCSMAPCRRNRRCGTGLSSPNACRSVDRTPEHRSPSRCRWVARRINGSSVGAAVDKQMKPRCAAASRGGQTYPAPRTNSRRPVPMVTDQDSPADTCLCPCVEMPNATGDDALW
jgi:hypothetical protein